MTVIIDIDHETTDLSQYTSTVTDGGDLSAETAAALAGTSYGLQCNIDDQNAIYGVKTLAAANTSGVLRLRFYMDPHTLTMLNGHSFTTCRTYNNSSGRLFYLTFGYTTGSGYWFTLAIYDDGDSPHFAGSTTYITDEEHYVEIQLTRSTGVSDNNGSIDWWIDGVAKTSATGIDNYDRFVNFYTIQIGAGVGDAIDSGTEGTYFIDEIIANDDGSEIGPYSSGDLTASVSDGLTLGESMQSVASLGNIDVALDNANYQGRGVRII